jgi:hypothetical protein
VGTSREFVACSVSGILAVLFILAAASFGQVVKEASQVPCSEEVVRPNLEVKGAQHIFGDVKDQTGAPFRESKIILRKEDSKGLFVDYRSVQSDKNGHFDLKIVEQGRYRFLPAPNRGWRQPETVECGDSKHCEMKLTLDVRPTDRLYAGCDSVSQRPIANDQRPTLNA